MRQIVLLTSLALFALGVPASGQGRVVRYEPKESDLKYVYGTMPPVATLQPGDVLETRTADCFGGVIQKPGDPLSKVKGDNPLTGPFAIAGAEPGDTLVVKILDIEVDGPRGVGALAPGFGALNPTNYTPMLNTPLPEHVWFYDIDPAGHTSTFHALDSAFSVKIPLTPFFGCIGVAPAGGEARSSVTPGEWGGNMDASEARAGNTVYFPVNVPGALLFMGDGHAGQGDGEVAGTGIEVPLRAKVQVDLIKKQAIRWPRFETDHMLMTVGAYRPLDDALRIAFAELVAWIHADYGLSELDAYELLSKVASIHLAEMVDPNYVIVAGIDKRYLPTLPPKR
ncbi:MAG TPA: acetamidase/formamidase family protein [Thermoanaerobaculia bacterium]|nr:acetamidase/formamidase family protein [Thermoanaerobaculia bacterium]